MHEADARDDARARRIPRLALRSLAVHAPRRERRDLEEGAPRVEQRVDAIAGQQLAARDVPLARRLRPAERDPVEPRAQLADERLHRSAIRAGGLAGGIDVGRQGADGSAGDDSVGQDAPSAGVVAGMASCTAGTSW